MSSIGRSTALLATGTVISRLLGFIKTVLLAAVIGNSGSQVAAAFGLANLLPNNIYILVAGGVLSAVLVPQIVKASSSADHGQAFVSKLFTLGLTVFTLVSIAATIAAPLIVGMYSSAQDNDEVALAVAFAYWCMPQILFYALYALIGEVFNAQSKFGPYTWAPVANNIVSITGLVIFYLLFGGAETNRTLDVWTPDRVAWLGGFATAGVAIQAILLILLFRRTGFKLRLDFGWKGVELRSTGKRAGWLFGIMIIGQIKGLAQTNVVTAADPAGANVFTMQNAWYIFSVPHSVITVSIAIAFFTRMSQHATKKDMPGLRRDISTALRAVGLLTTISAVTLAVIAVPFFRLFDHPHFSLQIQSSLVLWAMLLGLVAFSAEFVLQRVFFALEDTKTPFIWAVIGMLVTFTLLGACLLLPSSFYVVGASVAASIASLISCGAWTWLVRRKIGAFGLRLIAITHLQYMACAVVAAVPGAFTVWILGGFDPNGYGSSDRIPGLVTAGAGGAVMVLVYFGLLFAVRNPELRYVGTLVRQRFFSQTMPRKQ